MRAFALFSLCLASLAAFGCQTRSPSPDYAELRVSRDPLSVAAQISKSVRACWLGGKRPAFAELTSAAELTSYSNRPRILIVPKRDPHGLPQLVIEASAADRGASVKLFGPLMASAEAPAIHRDIGRWAGGGSGC